MLSVKCMAPVLDTKLHQKVSEKKEAGVKVSKKGMPLTYCIRTKLPIKGAYIVYFYNKTPLRGCLSRAVMFFKVLPFSGMGC
jgi:hypothetical protein